MFTETKKAFALVALIALTGVAAVELSRDSAQADPRIVAGGAAGYAGGRVDGAFELVAAMPAAAPLSFAVAEKGDLLPVGCAGPFLPNVAAECMDTAYEVASDEPAVIVETRGTSSSILTRLARITVAGF